MSEAVKERDPRYPETSKQINRKFTPEQKDAALAELALAGGSHKLAVVRIKERHGFKVSDGGLRLWSDSLHADRYAEICKELLPQVEARFIAQLSHNASEAHIATQEAVALARQQIAKGEVKDPAGTARNLATVAGISVDKIGEITGRPKVIEVRHTADELWSELHRLAPTAFVDSEAHELPA